MCICVYVCISIHVGLILENSYICLYACMYLLIGLIQEQNYKYLCLYTFTHRSNSLANVWCMNIHMYASTHTEPRGIHGH